VKREELAAILSSLKVEMTLDKATYTFNEFMAMARQHPDLVPVSVEKMRFGFTVEASSANTLRFGSTGLGRVCLLREREHCRHAEGDRSPGNRRHAQHQLSQGSQAHCWHGIERMEHPVCRPRCVYTHTAYQCACSAAGSLRPEQCRHESGLLKRSQVEGVGITLCVHVNLFRW